MSGSGGSTGAGNAAAVAVALSANTAAQELGGLTNPLLVVEAGFKLVATCPSGAVTLHVTYFE